MKLRFLNKTSLVELPDIQSADLLTVFYQA